MRLFLPELEIGPDEGFAPDKDIFGRKEFGDRLTRIVSTLEGPAVLVLDAPWGTGKTTFVKMWRGALTTKGITNIYFDAFKNDYHEDAFLALAGEIVARVQEQKPRNKRALTMFKTRAVRVAKVLGRAGLHVGVRLGTAGALSGSEIEEATKEAAKVVGEEAAKSVDELLEERLESHNGDREAFAQFGTALNDLANALTGEAKDDRGAPPLLFIIDELDRCRPTFALELLEKVKHFFSVPGVIFVLVTNLSQLEIAVRLAYGETLDARTYLEKFFQLRLLFPEGNLERRDLAATTYMRHLFRSLHPHEAQGYAEQTVSVISEFSKVHPLSLRTLERIAGYHAVLLASTNDRAFRPQTIVALLCVMKVIAPGTYAAARSGRLTFAELDNVFHFSRWRDEHSENTRSRIGEQTEAWWRCALGEIGGATDNAKALVRLLDQYNIDPPRRAITLLCDMLDGFSLPG